MDKKKAAGRSKKKNRNRKLITASGVYGNSRTTSLPPVLKKTHGSKKKKKIDGKKFDPILGSRNREVKQMYEGMPEEELEMSAEITYSDSDSELIQLEEAPKTSGTGTVRLFTFIFL